MQNCWRFAEGGQSEATDSSLRIRNADAVTFILSAATSFVNYHDISGDPAAVCGRILSAINDVDYATLRRRHEADFGALMNRVRLQVGDESRNSLPTDERLKAVREGKADPNLEGLCFQFGRYLLAASSRVGGQPANLQGIWNESVSPPWGSKYTININTEMNYWPAEVCNLAECDQPLFDLLQDIAVTGAKTAKTYYGCGGWVAHHNIDLWRGTAPVDAARFGMWPVGGAWLCQHLWEHYAFQRRPAVPQGILPDYEGRRPVPAGSHGGRAQASLAGDSVFHVPGTRLSRRQWETGLSLALTDLGCGDHERIVPALHRREPSARRGRGLPSQVGSRAQETSTLSN